MSTLVWLAIVLSTALQPGSAADRDAITKIVTGSHACIQTSAELWSETTPESVVIGPIVFLSPATAVVGASCTRFGSVIVVQRRPMRILMRKEGQTWRVASLQEIPQAGVRF